MAKYKHSEPTHPMRCIGTLLLLIAAHAALPPGFEENLLCAPGRCLQSRRDPRPAGFSGPRPMFHECCNETHPHDRPVRPRAWGVLVGDGYLAALKANGFHETECPEDSPCGRLLRTPTRQAIHALHATMDRMLNDC